MFDYNEAIIYLTFEMNQSREQRGVAVKIRKEGVFAYIVNSNREVFIPHDKIEYIEIVPADKNQKLVEGWEHDFIE